MDGGVCRMEGGGVIGLVMKPIHGRLERCRI